MGAQPSGAAGGVRAALGEGAHEVEPLKRRARPAQQPDRERQAGREREHRPVDADLLEAGDLDRREGGYGAEQQGRHAQAGRAAGQAQHRAFGQELPHEPAAARAEGRADGEQPPAGHAARQQQARGVQAGDQQHEHGHRAQYRERRAVLADHDLQ